MREAGCGDDGKVPEGMADYKIIAGCCYFNFRLIEFTGR